MGEPRSSNSNIYQGGGHFEFSSEKNWGIEQDDCKMFDSIDIPHLADSIASVPFHLRYSIPAELFTVEQLEEFEVESSLAFSRHTFQLNSKLRVRDKTEVPTTDSTTETNKLIKLILKNDSNLEEDDIALNREIQSNEQLDAILGNMKPLINILQDESRTINSINTNLAESKTIKNQMMPIKFNSEIEVTNPEPGHWLDSMLDDSDE